MNGPPGWPDDLAAVLHSAGPHPGLAEQLDLFGRLDEQMFIRRRGHG